jgi:large subunit ribosomal protein L27
MLQPRISSVLSPSPSVTALAASLTALTLTSAHNPSITYLDRTHESTHNHTQVRTAYHAAQGQANGPKNGAGKRLGLKKGATAYVVPGTMIFRQRGTKWHPGENVGIGRDHTIYSKVAGYVRYYRDPRDTGRHKNRKYIGVVFEREGPESKLPTMANAKTRRRVGMVGVPMKPTVPVVGGGNGSPIKPASMESTSAVEKKDPKDENIFSQPLLTGDAPNMRRGQYRISNTELAQLAIELQPQIKPFERKDRWKAWRVRAKKAEARRLSKAAGQAKKQAKKAKQVKRKAAGLPI